MKRDESLKELLLEGLNSGKDIPLTDQFWKNLRSEALQMMEKRKTPKTRK